MARVMAATRLRGALRQRRPSAGRPESITAASLPAHCFLLASQAIMRLMRRNIAWVTAALLFTIGCGADPVTPTGSTGAGGDGGAAAAAAATPRPSRCAGASRQIAVWKAPPGTKLEVRDAADKVVASGEADKQGSLIFRHVPPGDAYAVSAPDLVPAAVQKPVRVTTAATSLPKQEFYSGQKLKAGYTYLTMRDGTQLAAFITLPGPPSQGLIPPSSITRATTRRGRDSRSAAPSPSAARSPSSAPRPATPAR